MNIFSIVPHPNLGHTDFMVKRHELDSLLKVDKKTLK
jgi:hypothetical protein